ncbi:hypothetical protein, partial [Alistipes sp. ZOR0009]|uniref:hypothetical protein n=1 Tax=Alistipes sp. ZOR0009 TaxID=1339253 RepID=UPI001E4B0672
VLVRLLTRCRSGSAGLHYRVGKWKSCYYFPYLDDNSSCSPKVALVPSVECIYGYSGNNRS